MSTAIPLTRLQRELLGEFYSLPPRKILLAKKARDVVWKSFIEGRSMPQHLGLQTKCPALAAEISKSLASGNLVQSAVFSECVYAQALADQFGLTEFAIYAMNPRLVNANVEVLLRSYNLVPRYIYSNLDGSRLLIQAGGNGGVDGALISVIDNNIFTIEFKEPVAKTSEADLPKYGEDGCLRLTDEWAGRYPQFVPMMLEQIEQNLNFWTVSGSNVHGFTPASVQQAVSENYAGKKFADVICTEDTNGILTMVPSNQAHLWADVRGEIRPAGRNPYTVWTPRKLESYVSALSGSVAGGVVRLPMSSLVSAKPRGGTGISRFKISPIFFVRAVDVRDDAGTAVFLLKKVKQLNPTISAHMNFRGLEAGRVRAYYSGGF